MGKHLKRLAAPRSWKIKRKEGKWIVKCSPGPHKSDQALPLLLIVRDFLGYAKTTREAKRIIKEGKILVDKVVRKDLKFPIGLMDVIEIPQVKERKIVVFDEKGKLTLKKLLKKNSKYKLLKIINKRLVKGGNVQLNLHDGRNILIKDPKYKTLDTIVFDFKKKSIIGHLPFKKGNIAFITGGSHKGKVARIESLNKIRSPQPNTVALSLKGSKFETLADYVFVIGEKEPYLPEILK